MKSILYGTKTWIFSKLLKSKVLKQISQKNPYDILAPGYKQQKSMNPTQEAVSLQIKRISSDDQDIL